MPNSDEFITYETEHLTPELIAVRLSDASWITDPEALKILILDITALLIRFNTDTYKGTEFLEAYNSIVALLRPLIDSGFINLKSTNIQGRNFISISTDGAIATANIENGLEGKGRKVKTDHLFVHAHYDVVPPLEKLGGFSPFVTSDLNLLAGRGAFDMKSQIAIIIMLFYYCSFKGLTAITINISAWEEQASRNDKNFLNCSGLINVDLEPTGNWFGVPVNGIEYTKAFIVEFHESVRLEPGEHIKMINEIKQVLAEAGLKAQMALNDMDFTICLEDNNKVAEKFKQEAQDKVLDILEKYNINLLGYDMKNALGFNSRVTRTARSIIKDAFSHITPRAFESDDPRSNTVVENIDKGFGSLFGVFNTALTLSGNSNFSMNTIIFGPHDNIRHTDVEILEVAQAIDIFWSLTKLAHGVIERRDNLISELEA
jgi:hypothetical protein